MRKFFQARSAHALTPPRDARAQPTRPRQRQRRGTPERAGGAGGRVRGRRARASRAGSTGAWHGVRGDGQGVLSSVVRAHCSALLALGQRGGATSQRSRSRSPLPARHSQEGRLLARQACAALHRSGTAKAMKPEAPRSAGGGVAGGPVSPSMSRARRARVGDKDHIHGTVAQHASHLIRHLQPVTHSGPGGDLPSPVQSWDPGLVLRAAQQQHRSLARARNATGDRPFGPAASFPCPVHFGSAIALDEQRRPTRSF